MTEEPGTTATDRYTHGHHDSVLRSHRWRTAANSAAYLLPHLAPDAEILDIGCGPGTITIDLARRVPDGRVVGVDNSADIIGQARGSAQDTGTTNVTFACADVYRLPYADGTFDVVHAHQTLQHLSDPVAALREMRRVARPGGLVAARDSDYGGMRWYPSHPGIDAWQSLYQRVARSVGGEPDAGRTLHAWARQAGLTDVTSSSSTWTYATPDEIAWWSGLWAERILQSAFADNAIAAGVDPAELTDGSRAWQDWGASEAAWFMIPSGEILARR